ncbi:T9SS type A sorting domain-containing protein [Owenweeksia hongkongensis]|uniref:T9SS type A sorting domain-containing protein n=1 Tax=Owenweeksia hongkongensis TaxID=253245 RepID=UPI003A91B775
MKQFILSLFILLSTVSIGQNQNLSNGNVFDGEPYLAIDPYNSQHLVVAWMGWINFSNLFKIKIRSSFDGGKTWSSTVELPHTVTSYSSVDPSLDFDHNGDVFVCFIDFTGTTPPVTGGVHISKSTDGGLSWATPTEVINTNYDGTKWPIDRPWIAIDRSSAATQGNIYVSSMPLNRNNPSYRPYLSVSTDGGNTFTTSYIDTAGWLAGSINPLPLCSPAISSTGTFYGAYPSYVISQSPYAQTFLASSTNGGKTISHKNLITFVSPTNISNYPLAKKANLLICDPSDANHLAYIFLTATHGDLDVFFIESVDAGNNWTSPIRVNDDPIGNNRMQDLLWADFDTDGDLVISWRDRRNGADSTFQASTEIWASYRSKDSASFSPNFQITNQAAAHDTVLEAAGNDFMCIKLQDDTLNATWGDTQNGDLNIWFQRMTADGTTLSLQSISSEKVPTVFVYPNPAVSTIYVESKQLQYVKIYDSNGRLMISKQNTEASQRLEINLENYAKGTYHVEISTAREAVTTPILKQ